ncbi:ParA family protein [Weissella minor]|uniref:ParA family protein n=1 Tax=Weissella minor TaxID=1620 RepID=UPI00201198FF|nr:ParA family protein [Weissella minor]
MKIMTFSASKGGVGKTTLSYNFGSWLAHSGYNVLLIDADYQANLSSTFNMFTNQGTLLDVFTDGSPKIRHIKTHLDLLPASPNLDQVESLVHDRMYRELIMMGWLKDNIDQINQYDYVVIDTHPEFGMLTKNMIAVSDYVFVPLEPSDYGFQQSKNQFDIRMNEYRNNSKDPRTGESDIDAKVFYIANRIRHNTNTSHTFKKAIESLPDVVAQIDEREMMNSSTLLKKPVIDLKPNSQSNREFITELEKQFETIRQHME